jgi:hypothetical protein
MDMTALFLSRLQFAFTVSFHITFPSFTIGLAAWLTVLEASHLATGRSAYRLVFDDFDLGVGILFGLTRSEARRHAMFVAVALADSVRRRRDETPFYMVALIFTSAFGTLAVSFLALHTIAKPLRPSPAWCSCSGEKVSSYSLSCRSTWRSAVTSFRARLGQPPTTTSGSPQRRERIHGVDARQCMPDGLVPDCCVMIAQLRPDKMPRRVPKRCCRASWGA